MKSRNITPISMIAYFLVVMGFLYPGIIQANYQETGTIELKLRREVGFGLGGWIQGNFALTAEGPSEMDLVHFFIDDQLIGQDSSPPFSVGFDTDDFENSPHRLSAIGFTSDGEKLASNQISRQFVSVSVVALIVGAIIVLVVAFRIASSVIAKRRNGETGRGYGFLGGTICPNCGHAFGIHWWSLRLGVGRLDRCPQCGKWNMINRASPGALAEAESLALPAEKQEQIVAEDKPMDEEAYRNQLDNSRFDDR